MAHIRAAGKEREHGRLYNRRGEHEEGRPDGERADGEEFANLYVDEHARPEAETAAGQQEPQPVAEGGLAQEDDLSLIHIFRRSVG